MMRFRVLALEVRGDDVGADGAVAVADEQHAEARVAVEIDLRRVREPRLHRGVRVLRADDRRAGEHGDRLHIAVVVGGLQAIDDAADAGGVVLVFDVHDAAADADDQHGLRAVVAVHVGRRKVAVGDGVLGGSVVALRACVLLFLRVECDVDALEESGVPRVVPGVGVVVGDVREVRGVGGVEAMVAVRIQAGELAERGAGRVREARLVAGGECKRCESQRHKRRRGQISCVQLRVRGEGAGRYGWTIRGCGFVHSPTQTVRIAVLASRD